MTRADPDVLTPKKILFAKEFLVDLNQTQAAIRAGYSKNGAKVTASKLMDDPAVQKLIKDGMEERTKRVEVSADTVLRELLKIAVSDLRKLFDSKGSLLPPEEWPEDVAPAISSIEIEDLFEGYGEDRHQIGYTKKVKFWDKPKALELLGRHLKLYTDKIEVEGDLSIADSMRKARERAKEK